MAQVWARVLGQDTISVHDNFFDLGGDSILAIHVVVGALEAGLVLKPAPSHHPADHWPSWPPWPCRSRFESMWTQCPSRTAMVSSTSTRCRRCRPACCSTPCSIRRVPTTSSSPSTGSRASSTPGCCGVAWEHVVDRHPVLRTTFAWDGLPHPVQRVHRSASVKVGSWTGGTSRSWTCRPDWPVICSRNGRAVSIWNGPRHGGSTWPGWPTVATG